MKAMTAADAKNSFGSFLDAVQHEPVVVTKKSRPVGVMFSMQDVEALFGGEAITDLMIEQKLHEARIDRRIEQGRLQVKAGKVTRADADFFASLREEIKCKTLRKQ